VEVPPTARTSARSLLLTVLGEFVLPDGGAAWTGALVGALGACGVEEKAARQAVARASSAGWLRSERIGRRARWHLTDWAERLLTEGTERIYSFGAERPRWDGRWLLVLVSVPERHRHLRYRLRTRLTWAGFGALGPGAWISPDLAREEEAARVLRDLGLDEAVSFTAEPGSIGAAAELVREAWDLGAIDAAYEAFLAETAAAEPGSPTEAFAAVVRLVHTWRRFPFLDPGLPVALPPAGWSGTRAATAFHECHDTWAPAAWMFYKVLTEGD
jgi:phenylacetic acid degradation operon negative regulatory protein